jgi:cell division protease FtsH
VLLVGAPGTGKTLLARAVAGEAGVPFISISASEFVELYVGMGAARVREVFARAKAQSPAIVFIDEIDAVAKTRGDGKLRGMGNDEREQTLNQLLTELDGFETESLVICIAATNRPDSLDAALRRPGRFDRTVSVDRPDKQGRKEILAVHTKRRALPLAADAGLDVIAQMTAGFTGADLENLVNEAALLAGRAGKTNVGYSEFEAAVLRTVAGIEKKRSLLTMSEKRTVSAHEVGHALVATAVGRLLPDTERPETLSIVSRSGGALGFTYTPPTEDKSLMYKDELLGKVTMFMGGRAAEMVVCKRISSGASDDIQRATNLAYKSIAELGFSANVGPMSVSTLSAGGNEEMLIGSDKSSESDAVVEREVKHTLSTALLVACDVVRSNAEVMAELTKVLSENEKVQGAELQAFLNRVVAPPSLAAYLRGDAPPITKADIDLMSTFPLPEVLPPGVAR